MGWSLGYDNNWHRDIGYAVPAICDFPTCSEEIDRGLGNVCGDEPYGGELGCGLFFCGKHLTIHNFRGKDNFANVCQRCDKHKPPFDPKPDVWKWMVWKLVHDSWQKWRDANPDEVNKIKENLINIID